MKKYIVSWLFLLVLLFFSWCTTIQETEEIAATIETWAVPNIHMYTIKSLPSWARDLWIGEPKLIWLQDSLSYEKIIGENYLTTIIFYDTSSAIQRETERLIGENNLEKITCSIDDIQAKTEKDSTYLLSLWVEQASIDDMWNKRGEEVFECYSKRQEIDGMEYSIRLLQGKDQMILDVSYIKKSKALLNTGIYLVSLGSNERCEYMDIQDEKGNAIVLPPELEENLSWCGDESVVISPNNQFIFFNYIPIGAEESKFLLYNREDQKLHTLGYEDGEIEWIKCLWNTNNKDIACAIVHQQKYVWLTKMIVFSINQKWESLGMQEFVQDLWASIDFVCGDSCYVWDFWFVRPFEIQYAGHREISPEKIYSIVYK